MGEGARYAARRMRNERGAARVDPFRKALAFIAEHGRHSFDREQARAALASCAPSGKDLTMTDALGRAEQRELEAIAKLDEARSVLARIGREERGSNPDHILCGQCKRAVGHCDDDGECAGAVARAALRKPRAP